MYLSRTNNLIDLLLYLVLTGGWAVGGWLLVAHAFRLHRVERVVCGLAAGLLLFISLSNLLAHFLPLSVAFWASPMLIFLAGAGLAWRSKLHPWLEKRDLLAFPIFIGLVIFTTLFTLILKGESIFDEYLHLPLISTMAAGDIPPHFYLNPALNFAYHYGIQVFAASLVRLADFFPWSAWDVSRALAIAFTLVLGWVWVRRITRSRLAAWLGSILFTFGGGARWMLLLLPAPWLNWVSKSVNLDGSGFDTASTLAEALYKPWAMQGGGPVAYPFAFHNGIFTPVFFTLGSTGAMPFMTILLLLLLMPRGRFSAAGLFTWCLLFTTLSLSAEHLFVALWIGIAGVACISFLFRKRLFKSFPTGVFYRWAFLLAISALLSLIQGGFITETARNWIAALTGNTLPSINARGFSFRWPPGLLSAHLGFLSLDTPGQVVALLAELGPALLMVAVIFIRFEKMMKQKDWFSTGLAVSVPLGLIFPLFFQYGVDRSTTRMPATALWTCLVLSFPLLWMAFRHAKTILRLCMVIGYLALLLAGVILFRTQLYSIPNTEYTYFVDKLDAGYAADYWNELPAEAQVLDRIPERSVTLFGRITRAHSSIYEPLPEWEALIADPNPSQIVSGGYDYVYMDSQWWQSLTLTQQNNFLQPCIDFLEERHEVGGQDYSLLVNVSACK